MHAADSASPTATGASNTPGSGRRTFKPRSLSTASHPKTTTRPADRMAQVSRQLRATSGATRTGRYSAIARMPNCPLPNPNLARRVTPSAWLPIEPAGDPSATGDGTPAMRSHPWRPNNDEDHGRLARKPRSDSSHRDRQRDERRPPRPTGDQSGDRQHDSEGDDEQGERRHERKRDGCQQRQLAQHPQPATRRDRT